MADYAKGSKALGICDKTGFRYLLSDMVYEYSHGRRTGLRVGKDVADPDHPQNFVGRRRVVDPMALRDPRPDTAELGLFGWKPVGHTTLHATGAVGGVVVLTIGD